MAILLLFGSICRAWADGPPAITAQPISLTVVVGAAATFTVTATGTTPLNYQWNKGSNPISGATAASLVINNCQPTDAGSYNCSVTNGLGFIVSSSAVLTVGVAPSISAQPQDQTLAATYNATFSVAAAGSSPLSYQWQKSGVPIAGATTASLTLVGAQPADTNATYSVVVSNAFGTVSSIAAALTVSTPLAMTTRAGQLTAGSTNGVGISAQFNLPYAVCVDSTGNLFVADYGNSVIRKIDSLGNVTTVAGSPGIRGNADGPVSTATFNLPQALTIDSAGNLFIADTGNNSVRKISTAGIVSTIDRGYFSRPTGIAVDGTGNVFVANSGSVILRIDTSENVTVFAGGGTPGGTDGQGGNASFSLLEGIAIDAKGNLYAADEQTIRKISPTGFVSTLAGTAGAQGHIDATGSNARFFLTCSVAVDGAGTVYATEQNSHDIRCISPAGVVTTLAGHIITTGPGSTFGLTGSADGIGDSAYFNLPSQSGAGLAVDSHGTVYLADTWNNEIRVGTLGSPLILSEPLSQAIPLGGTVSFSVAPFGNGPFSFQWLFNGTPIPGATGTTFSIGSVQNANAGTYSAQVVNAIGTMATRGAILTVDGGSGTPVILSQPSSSVVPSHTTVTYAVAAQGVGNTYQWLFNGVPLSGATSARLVLQGASSGNAGVYTCLVTNAVGTSASTEASLAISPTSNPGRLINLSVLQTTSAAGPILTVGFVTGGPGTNGSQNLLIRAIGPSLTAFGLSGLMPDPELTLFSGTVAINSNDNWGSPPGNQAAVTAADLLTFAFPLTNPASDDAALVTSLASQGYSVQVTGNSQTPGTVLAEIYDATAAGAYLGTSSHLINLSTSSQVTAGASLTEGFVVGGNTSKTVLLRAIGPALASFGVAGTMPDPKVTLHTTVSGQDVVLATNAGWGGDPQIAAISTAVSAFALSDPASADSVLLVTLPPGSYSAVASSVSGTAGVVLVEAYEVP